jgi:hypothetical protein
MVCQGQTHYLITKIRKLRTKFKKHDTVPTVIQLFRVIIYYYLNKLEQLSLTGPYSLALIKARAYPSEEPFRLALANIRPFFKDTSETNTLAYFASLSVTVKSVL